MLMSKALRILCSRIINNKFLSLPERWEGRRSAAPRPEEALDLTQEFLASWFICPQRYLLSYLSGWCVHYPQILPKENKKQEWRIREREGKKYQTLGKRIIIPPTHHHFIV